MPGGADVNGNPVYIGNGFVKTRGIIPGVIIPNQRHITVPSYGSQKVDTYITVNLVKLCTGYVCVQGTRLT